MTSTDTIARITAAIGPARLIGWQFAANVAWDTAIRAFFEQLPEHTTQTVQKWLDKQTTQDIAFEAIFELQTAERFFFGVRLTTCDHNEKTRILRELLTTGKKYDAFADTIQRIRDILQDQELAKPRPEYLELGVFDLWNRVKPMNVWIEGGKFAETSLLSITRLNTEAQKPDPGFSPLYASQPNPQQLAAEWKDRTNFPCWTSLPVGNHEKTTNLYTLSAEKYLTAATTLIGYEPVVE